MKDIFNPVARQPLFGPDLWRNRESVGAEGLLTAKAGWVRGENDSMELNRLEQALHTARALVMADLLAGDVAEAEIVSSSRTR